MGEGMLCAFGTDAGAAIDARVCGVVFHDLSHSFVSEIFVRKVDIVVVEILFSTILVCTEFLK